MGDKDRLGGRNLTGLPQKFDGFEASKHVLGPCSLICSGQLKPGLEVCSYGYRNLRGGSLKARLLPHRLQIRATAMRHLRSHTDGLRKGWVRVNALTNIHRVRPHLDSQGNLANHVAGVGADHATAQDLAVAVGFRAVVTLAATCASCTALSASMGWPTMSPVAKMCGTLVRIWMSTGMKPRSVTAIPALSAAIFLPLGVRPKA